MSKLIPDIFEDVFGPVMQPGSSSHTAGPCKIGNEARKLVKGKLKEQDCIANRRYGKFNKFAIVFKNFTFVSSAVVSLGRCRRLGDY